MNENTRVKTVKSAFRLEFEGQTDKLIEDGYKMISAGYSMNENRKTECWWAILVKEETQ